MNRVRVFNCFEIQIPRFERRTRMKQNGVRYLRTEFRAMSLQLRFAPLRSLSPSISFSPNFLKLSPVRKNN